MNEFNLIPEEHEAGDRLDIFLTSRLEDYSRSAVKRVIDAGLVTVNGKQLKSNYKLRLGDNVRMEAPVPVEADILPEDIPLNILYEDESIIVINKEQGMVVHPAAGNYNNTLVNALMFHCRGKLSGINGQMRPGIVHRIDKDTSGILVAAKNDVSHRLLAEQFHEHSINRKYIAVARGCVTDDYGTIDKPIGRSPVDRKKMAVNFKNGKRAVTHYRVIERYRKYTLLEASLETGRTHQIRVHLSSISHPLAGDTVYGPDPSAGPLGPDKKPLLNGQALHARLLGFIHPSTNEYMEFNAEPPEYFNRLLDTIK